MRIAKVIGAVVSTRKHEGLQGVKLLLVESAGEVFIAGDILGAGEGEYVMVTTGNAATRALDKEVPVDAMVVGILDNPPKLPGGKK